MPPLPQLLKRFFASPLTSRHFADQHFLRRYVWPYARQSLLQHDSMFGFLGAKPFPGGPMPDDFHVGYAEGSPFFTAQTALPEGSAVVWQFWRTTAGEAPPSAPVCTYPARVKDGKVTAHLPARYARWLREETATIRIVESGA